MGSETADHAQILQAARNALAFQQQGGRRASGRSIGRRSAELKRQHALRKLMRASLAVGVILLAAIVAGFVIGGIGIGGFLLTLLAMIGAAVLFATSPRLKIPALGALNRGDVRATVGRTQLWLESQRADLPVPAARQLDAIGTRLDALGTQLAGIDPSEPAVGDVRRLIGEHLPDMVASYTRIPAHLRNETRSGKTSDAQLSEGLGKITDEIDALSRRLAEGDIDALATEARYLDYRYGNAIEDKS